MQEFAIHEQVGALFASFMEYGGLYADLSVYVTLGDSGGQIGTVFVELWRLKIEVLREGNCDLL